MHENFFVQKDVPALGNVGQLVVHAKSAHVYEPEWTLRARLAGVAEPVG